MKLIIIVFSLLLLTLLPFTISDGFAQCILTPNVCFDSPVLSLVVFCNMGNEFHLLS